VAVILLAPRQVQPDGSNNSAAHARVGGKKKFGSVFTRRAAVRSRRPAVGRHAILPVFTIYSHPSLGPHGVGVTAREKDDCWGFQERTVPAERPRKLE